MSAKIFRPILFLVALIWGVELVNLVLGHRLGSLVGIEPRSLGGLIGIPLAPLIHVGLLHAVSNTIPLLILGGLTIIGNRKEFWETTITVALLTGALVWVFGRNGVHVGASGLVFGYFGVIVARAAVKRGVIEIATAIVTIIFYGGLLWGVLPHRNFVSFESHIFGLVAGIFIVWLNYRLGKSQPE